MQKIYFKTFGCRSNLYDTQVMISNIKDYEVILSEEGADIIVVNSCTVTNKADREIRSYVRKYATLGKKIVFTGCGVKHLGKSMYDSKFAFSLFSHSHKESINEILSSKERVFLPKDREYKHVDSTLMPSITGRIRAFIKIQEGCNFACSYCIIPSVRGAARSFPREQILAQIELLAKSGVSEVILTGTNIGSYGLDTGDNIAFLIRDIHEIEGIRRIRLGSLEPSQIDKHFLDILHLDKLERHLHIALQHTSPRMLSIMNRKNEYSRDKELFENLYKRGFSIGTDYIVGHHGESEEIFNEALRNLEELFLTHIHPFIYSPRIGTKSAINKERLEHVKGDVAKARLKRIESIVREKNRKFREECKEELDVLIDSKKDSGYSGLDQYFNRVCIDKSLLKDIEKGTWVKVNRYKIEENNIALELSK